MSTRRYHGPLTEAKHTNWKKLKKKTAAEILERADEGNVKLTAAQRKLYEAKAGNKYKKRDPLEKRKDETVQQYVNRIQAMFK